MVYLYLLLGFIALIIGGEALVKGAVSLAFKLRISPLVVGMTIVSFGTSAPELLVSIGAATTGHPDVSIGAVVGSNISNLGLVLGLTVIIFPISIGRDTLRIDWPLMILASILFFAFARNEEISSLEGIIFLAILVSFTSWLFINSRKQGKKAAEGLDIEIKTNKKQPLIMDLIYLGIGFSGLTFGADWLIDSVVSIAKDNGVSEKLISVSVVAFGTSLPELVTSCTAAYRKESDISIGNLIGSNVFNLLAILGVTAVVHPIQVNPTINTFDVFVMLGISALIFPLMLFGKKLNRWKGILLILIYCIYIYFSIIKG